MSTVRSLKVGNAASDRRVSTTAVGAVPTTAPVPGTPRQGLNLNGGDFLHIYAAFSGGANAATVTPWYYSSIAGLWFKGDSIAFTATQLFALIEVRGEEQVYFTVDVLNAGTIDLWAGYSFEDREA